jgi:hypothetical protein
MAVTTIQAYYKMATITTVNVLIEKAPVIFEKVNTAFIS